MKEEVIQLLNSINNSIDFLNETKIFSANILNSLEFVELISLIEGKYEFSFEFDDLEFSNFDSVDLIIKQIEKY